MKHLFRSANPRLGDYVALAAFGAIYLASAAFLLMPSDWLAAFTQ
jgi:hypothetical protein